MQLGETKTWFDNSVLPISQDSVVWTAHDITKSRQAEERKVQLDGQMKNQRECFESILVCATWQWILANAGSQKSFGQAQARQMALPADISPAFASKISLQEILQQCAEALVKNLDATLARI